MRVTINRSEKQSKEKTGLFSSRIKTSYIVQAVVEFSETEIAIVRKSNLGNTVLYHEHFDTLEEFYKSRDIPYKDEVVNFYLTIDKLIAEPFQRGFDTPLQANQFENKLKSDILPTLKSFIQENIEARDSAEAKSETLSFEWRRKRRGRPASI